MSHLNSRPRFTLIHTRLYSGIILTRLHHLCYHAQTKRLLQGSVGQIIEIDNLLCSLFWIHITQELHHLNWNWLCVVHFVLKHRYISHTGTGDWWEATTALRRRGASGSAAFDMDGDGGHGGTCKIGC